MKKKRKSKKGREGGKEGGKKEVKMKVWRETGRVDPIKGLYKRGNNGFYTFSSFNSSLSWNKLLEATFLAVFPLLFF